MPIETRFCFHWACSTSILVASLTGHLSLAKCFTSYFPHPRTPTNIVTIPRDPLPPSQKVLRKPIIYNLPSRGAASSPRGTLGYYKHVYRLPGSSPALPKLDFSKTLDMIRVFCHKNRSTPQRSWKAKGSF